MQIPLVWRMNKISGTPDKMCDDCGAPLKFMISSKGNPIPYNMVTGEVHFKDCPGAKKFRKSKRRV